LLVELASGARHHAFEDLQQVGFVAEVNRFGLQLAGALDVDLARAVDQNFRDPLFAHEIVDRAEAEEFVQAFFNECRLFGDIERIGELARQFFGQANKFETGFFFVESFESAAGNFLEHLTLNLAKWNKFLAVRGGPRPCEGFAGGHDVLKIGMNRGHAISNPVAAKLVVKRHPADA
jgi:hypothetical protein